MRTSGSADRACSSGRPISRRVFGVPENALPSYESPQLVRPFGRFSPSPTSSGAPNSTNDAALATLDMPYQWSTSGDALAAPRPERLFPLPHNFGFMPNDMLCYAAQPVLGQESAMGGGYDLDMPSASFESREPLAYPGMQVNDSHGLLAEAYPPSAYQLEPHPDYQMFALPHSNGPEMSNTDEHHDVGLSHNGLHMVPDTRRSSLLPFSAIPSDIETAPTTRTGSPIDAQTPERDKALDDAPHEKEEPYAKLIWRALMEKPDHTMVLRDIYNWFRRNTDKASNKETKGWQNSIRHNLSMNGAFQKVDQPPGEEAKKGFLWRLTDAAVKEGVKSTTRYRSKLPNKRISRSTNPAPQRQASGAKGGQAARKSARLRRSERLCDSRDMELMEPYYALPVQLHPSPRNCHSDHLMQMELPTVTHSNSMPPSPYFMASNGPFEDDIGQRGLGAHSVPPMVGREPLGCMPAYSGREFVQLLQFPEEPFFCSSPESGEEPMTPPPFEDGASWISTDGLI